MREAHKWGRGLPAGTRGEPGRGPGEEDLRRRFEAARERRRPLFAETDAVRLADGEGDGLPGLFVDAYGACWVVSTKGGEFPRWLLGAEGWEVCFWRKLTAGEKTPPVLVADRAGLVASGKLGEFEVEVCERGARFGARPGAGYSAGLFLDQRENRAELCRLVRERAKETGRAPLVLNTFAYTCAFSVVAAAAGAKTVSVDLSGAALERGKANFARNGLSLDGAEFYKGDVFEWLPRFVRKGRKFDFVILDPPTFSRDARGRVFRVARDYGRLLELASGLASPGGWVLACVNMAAMSGEEFRGVIQKTCREAGRSAALRPGRLPPDFTAPPLMKSYWIKLEE